MSEENFKKFEGIVTKLGLSPLEAPSIIIGKEGSLHIGIPRERTFQEHRIPLIPEAVLILTNNGHKVVIETGAGNFSHYTDRDYSEAGAIISYDIKEVYLADIILKITPPSMEDAEMMKVHQTIVSPLHLPALKGKVIKKMISKKITALAFEFMQDESDAYPFVTAMSEIVGNATILIAADLLSNDGGGKGILLGGIPGVPPAKVVILGAGVIGENATKAALGLGAVVKVFDNAIYKLKRLQNHVGVKVFTSIFSPSLLADQLSTADVVIGAIHSKTGRTPIVISEELVKLMKPGSVIIDVSIDQGGCFETSEITDHDSPTIEKYEVVHYCVPNIASKYSRTASIACSNILAPVLMNCFDIGGMKNLLIMNKGLRNGTYMYNGYLTNEHMSHIFEIKYTHLDLLFVSGE
jgi:alanine dehydrogenase